MRLRSTFAALCLLPALLTACDDDPSGPVDQIYTLQSVQVEGRTGLTPPATLFEGRIADCGGGTPCDFRYQLRRATLALRQNGQYTFSAEYPLRFAGTGRPTAEFSEATFEDGTYVIRNNTITFNANGDSFLSPTGTLQNSQLIVGVTDPFEFFDDLMLTLSR